MNIYEKIAEARVRFQSRGVKMSGENKFAGYKYYELADILPAINAIGKELGFLCAVSFSDVATLEVIDTEKPNERQTFTSPMSTAALKGCHEVQNLGAVETYIKRYLYQNAFEIVEGDAVNATHDPNAKPTPPAKPAQPAKPSTPPPAAVQLAECAKIRPLSGLSEDAARALYDGECGKSSGKYFAALKAKIATKNGLPATSLDAYTDAKQVEENLAILVAAKRDAIASAGFGTVAEQEAELDLH